MLWNKAGTTVEVEYSCRHSYKGVDQSVAEVFIDTIRTPVYNISGERPSLLNAIIIIIYENVD